MKARFKINSCNVQGCSKILLILLFGILVPYEVISQKLERTVQGKNDRLILSHASTKEIKNDSILIGNIIDFCRGSEQSSYILSDGSGGVVEMDGFKKIDQEILGFGRGPGEYQSPSNLYCHNRDLYIWDSSLLKLIRYDITKGTADFEVKNFRYAISDFAIKNQLLVKYNSGKTTGHFIELYDLKKNKLIKKFGKRSEEHTTLMSIAGNGDLGIKSNYLYYVTPEKPVVYRINLDTYHIKESDKAIDPEFVVPNINNARLTITNPQKIRDFLFSTSMVSNIFLLEDYLVVVAKVGKTSFNTKIERYTPKNRKVRFYIYDYELNYLDTFSFSVAVPGLIQDRFWTTNGSQLMLISTFDIFKSNKIDNNSNISRKIYYWNITLKE